MPNREDFQRRGWNVLGAYARIAPDGRVTMPLVNFDVADHCNLRCMGCNHFSPFARPSLASLEEFRRDVGLLARYACCGRVELVGGEPLLHPEVAAFARAAKQSGLSDHVRVLTNGLLLARQPAEFWQAVDSVHVSGYPGMERRLDPQAFMGPAREHGTWVVISWRPLFQTPAVPVPNGDAGLVRDVFRACKLGRGCHTLRHGRLYRCAVAACLDRYLAAVGQPNDFCEHDGLLIEDRPDMTERIRAYLTSKEPLQSCRYCLGSAGRRVEQRQMTAVEVARPDRTTTVLDVLARDQLESLLRLRRWEWLIRRIPPWQRRLLHQLPMFGFLREARDVGAMHQRVWPPADD